MSPKRLKVTFSCFIRRAARLSAYSARKANQSFASAILETVRRFGFKARLD